MKRFSAASLWVYSVTVVALGVSTFLSPSVYGSLWFMGLWGVFAAVLAVAIFLSRMWRNAGRLLLHVSMLAILGGGLLTRFTEVKGSLRLSPGEESREFIGVDGSVNDLPVTVRLDRFEVEYYPGGTVPRDYVSYLTVGGEHETVSMNRVLDLEGYRLLQSSYDSTGATVLSVVRDPYGMPLSYCGYVLFVLGWIWLMVAPGSRFRRFAGSLGMVVISLVAGTGASAAVIEGVPREVADSLGRKPVVYEGRVVSFNTLARDVVTKLYGEPTYRGLSAEQTLLSLRLFPDRWKDEALIKIKDKGVRDAIGVASSHASLSQLFDSLGNYRVTPLYKLLGDKKRRGVEELDEKVGIILSLYSGDLIISPSENMEVPSEIRISAEIAYNSVPFTTIIFILLFCGFALGMFSEISGRLSGSSLVSFLRKAAVALLIAATCASASCFLLQWWLSGRVPLSNTFETLQFVTLILELLLLWVGRRGLLLSVGMLLAGAIALVAHLIELNPMVTPLMPVLHSGWLSLHVSLVMTAYAILCVTFVIAVVAFVRRSAADRLQTLSLTLLYPGVLLLAAGIFTGSVWAGVSWGAYWSWDPKETWALVTMLVYALPLHKGIVGLHQPKIFHLYMLLAILTVAMTYFGVNHLNSLHAYN